MPLTTKISVGYRKILRKMTNGWGVGRTVTSHNSTGNIYKDSTERFFKA